MFSSICRVSTPRGGDEMSMMSYSLIGDVIFSSSSSSQHQSKCDSISGPTNGVDSVVVVAAPVPVAEPPTPPPFNIF